MDFQLTTVSRVLANMLSAASCYRLTEGVKVCFLRISRFGHEQAVSF